MENTSNKNSMSVEEVADSIKKHLRNKYERDADFYAILFFLRKIINIKSKVSLKTIGSYYVEQLTRAQDDKRILEYCLPLRRVYEMMEELPKYFEIVAGNYDSHYNEIYVKPSDNFRTYINGLSDDEKNALKTLLTFSYIDVLYKRKLDEAAGIAEEIVVSECMEDDFDKHELKKKMIPLADKQYDIDKPKLFASLKDEVEWEAEHDVVLKTFHRQPEEKIDDDNYLDYDKRTRKPTDFSRGSMSIRT